MSIVKEFVEKLIGRLEENVEELIGWNHHKVNAYSNAIKIVKQLAEEYVPDINSGKWITCEEKLPNADKYILLSFENFSIPVVGRYEEDEEGGAFYIGDETESCLSQNLFVNAWQLLPEPYKSETQKEIPTKHYEERFNRVV